MDGGWVACKCLPIIFIKPLGAFQATPTRPANTKNLFKICSDLGGWATKNCVYIKVDKFKKEENLSVSRIVCFRIHNGELIDAFGGF